MALPREPEYQSPQQVSIINWKKTVTDMKQVTYQVLNSNEKSECKTCNWTWRVRTDWDAPRWSWRSRCPDCR